MGTGKTQTYEKVLGGRREVSRRLSSRRTDDPEFYWEQGDFATVIQVPARVGMQDTQPRGSLPSGPSIAKVSGMATSPVSQLSVHLAAALRDYESDTGAGENQGTTFGCRC